MIAIARFELAYQLRRAWPWLFAAALLALSFLMARDTSLADALYEDFFANAPFAVAKTTVVGTLVWLLLAPAIAGEAAARDVATRMYPLVYTTPITTADYLGGRLLAALAINAALLLAVQVGIVLGVYSPGVSAQVIGPFRPAAFLTAYAFISLPNAVVGTAVQFALAARSGRAMAGYAGSLLLVFMGFFVASILLFNQRFGTLLDPIGIRFVVEELARLWTPAEKNTRLLALTGTLLANRLLWLGVAFGTLAATFARFRFAHRAESARRWRRARVAFTPTTSESATPVVAPDAARTFGVANELRRTLAIARASFRALALSWAGLALLVVIPAVTVLVVIDQMSSLGTPLVPSTARVLAELTAPLAAELSRWVVVPLATVFFAGELVWREREAGLGEIVDAMPASDWAPLVGKLLGLALVLATLMTALAAAGVVAQTILGYHAYELGLYAGVLFGLQLPEYLLFAALALVVHVVVDQKYVAHLAAIAAYVFIVVVASMLGVEHPLLVYGAGPSWSYTPMRGFGGSVAAWAWLKSFWAAWALALFVVARLLWVRGRESGARERLRVARQRWAGATRRTAVVAAGLVVAVGAFVFYNTNVLHAYHSAAALKERSAEYERRHGRYARAAQPSLAGASLRVELYPERSAVDVGGAYRLVNRTPRPVDTIHVTTAVDGVETRALAFDRAASLVVDDRERGYRVYALGRPLAPGDSLQLTFAVRVARRGFGARGADPSVAAGGVYFTNAAWLPAVGYQRSRELLAPADRREHGLAPKPVVASLTDAEGRAPAARGGGVAFEAVVGTSGDQTAVAPGALRRAWTERGRRYFHYVADAPIGNEWAFFSARYEVREERWKNPSAGSGQAVSVRLFYDRAHATYPARMMRSVRAALDYYAAQLGPYPYGHLTIVENPAAPGTGLHAEPSVISHGQSFPDWAPRDTTRLDLPAAVVAHEMAHQWTVPYAPVEGAPFLSEGLAWYAAMQATRASRGDAELRRLLAFMRQPYPYRPIRRGAPLLRALDPYLAYRRGPFALYALSETISADRVNGALRRLIATHDAPGAPLATTLDLYRELRAATPDSLAPLLHELFEVNTFWTLATERATATRTPSGTWQVTLTVRARKVVADSAGAERDVPLSDWVEVGVFGADDDPLGTPLYLRRHRLRAGVQTITVTLPASAGEPRRAGVDPRRLLDWEARDDAVVSVSAASAAPRT